MKKVIVAICMVCATVAFAANEESVTSREYVDAGLDATQPTITTGTGVMTFDSSESDGIGQKAIYNPNGGYATQADALVTASATNTAVQNAINTEFECIEWDPNDNTVCWLVQIKAYQNLFNGAFLGGITRNIAYIYSSNTIITSPYVPGGAFHGPVFGANVEPGKKYQMSGVTNVQHVRIAFYASESDAYNPDNTLEWRYTPSNSKVTVPSNATYMVLSYSNANTNPITWSNVSLRKINENYLPTNN